MTNAEWFDERVIARLECMIGSKVVREIIDLFFETTPGRVEDVRSGDTELVARALHSLKSSAGMIGGTELQGLAQDLEQLARSNETSRIANRLGELEAAVARLRPRLEFERERIGG